MIAELSGHRSVVHLYIGMLVTFFKLSHFQNLAFMISNSAYTDVLDFYCCLIMSYELLGIKQLTHISLASFLWDIGKQCKIQIRRNKTWRLISVPTVC